MWTDDRVVILKKLWIGGYSAGHIANELGGVTRSAVIGKVHRLGLGGRRAEVSQCTRALAVAAASSSVVKSPRQSKPSTLLGLMRFQPKPLLQPAAARPKALPTTPPPDAPGEDRCTLMQLRAGRCRWPYGDPGAAGFVFCGTRTSNGAPYCAAHAGMAYRPADRRQRAARRAS